MYICVHTKMYIALKYNMRKYYFSITTKRLNIILWLHLSKPLINIFNS